MPSDIFLRNYAPEDCDQLSRIAADELVAMSFFGRKLIPTEAAEYFRYAWAKANSQVFTVVATCLEGGEIVGAAQINCGALSCFVSPEYFRKGVASQMLYNLLGQVGQLPENINLSALIVRENLPSIRLVEKFGFRFAGISRANLAGFSNRTMLQYVA